MALSFSNYTFSALRLFTTVLSVCRSFQICWQWNLPGLCILSYREPIIHLFVRQRILPCPMSRSVLGRMTERLMGQGEPSSSGSTRKWSPSRCVTWVSNSCYAKRLKERNARAPGSKDAKDCAENSRLVPTNWHKSIRLLCFAPLHLCDFALKWFLRNMSYLILCSDRSVFRS